MKTRKPKRLEGCGDLFAEHSPGAGVFLYKSNRLELLAKELARVVSAQPPSPFESEIIVVQSIGMRRWITLQLAQELGICMQCEFPFPRTIIENLLLKIVPEMAHLPSPAAIAWKIHAALPTLLKRDKAFAPVRSYLADGDGLKLFQLSEKIAQVFDQYAVFRPELIRAWEAGKALGKSNDEAWQAALWREVSNGEHLVEASTLFNKRCTPENAESLPRRISFFGVPALPPLHLQMLFESGKICAVHFFVFAPSQEYYGNEETPKQRAKCGVTDLDEYAVNPLLLSLGRESAGSTELLLETDERAGFRLRDGAEHFTDFTNTGEATLLQTIQSDILHARLRPSSETPRIRVPENDHSISIHACHSPMREVEVLYDQLLALFQNDPTLKPRDILVLTPEIETYAPFIHTVFAYPENEERRIPFSIADRHPRSESPLIDAFLRILELAGSRCAAPDLFSILESPPLRRRYGFSDDDLLLIRQWICDTGICWGVDGEHRQQLGVLPFEANTWRAGLDRLLLGYAMIGGNCAMFENILPYDEIEGASAELLGRFVSAAEAIFSFIEKTRGKHDLSTWHSILAATLEDFFSAENSDDAHDLRVLRGTLDELQKIADAADADQPVEFTVARHQLNSLLAESEQRGGFLTGGVTFCALKSLRAVPARVVCLLGMNEATFPRRAQPLQFDLMARKPQPGDPSARDDDRHMFLETLLAARERLIISFIGRSITNNEEIPPSVVVSELLDYLDQSCEFDAGKTAREWLVVEHRLHAFSPRYFETADDDAKNASGLFSFSEANAAASRSLGLEKQTAPAFFDASLPLNEVDETGENAIELRALISFFANPARHLLRERLKIRLEEDDVCLPDSEPIELDALDHFRIRQEMLEGCVGNGSAPEPEIFSARGVLAPGQLGRRQYRALHRDARLFHTKLRPHVGDGKKDEPLLVDLRIGDVTLTGRIDSIFNGRLIAFRCANLKARDWLQTWIQHLALCATQTNKPNEAMLLGRNRNAVFKPTQNSVEILTDLVGIYRDGMARPIPFFPESAFAFAEAAFRPSPNARSTPMSKAFTCWHGNSHKRDGEKENAYIALCHGEAAALDADFEKLANRVFKPLFDHLNT